MKNRSSYIMILVVIMSSLSFLKKPDTSKIFHYSGRVEKLQDKQVKLIGPASSVAFQFLGNTCEVILSVDTPDHYNYVSIELDGKYIGKMLVETGKPKTYTINSKNDKKDQHTLTIYKATEASVGGIIFHDVKVTKLLEWQLEPKKKIEFIGDSVFCGQGIDYMEINCGKEKHWFDQHNSYFSYPAIASKLLDYSYQISAVSGIGIYRNWNSEADGEKSMEEVYDNLYLNKDVYKPYKYEFRSDIIVIGLGNNDFYQGDDKKVRAEFESDLFTTSYIKFITRLQEHNPEASFVLVAPLLEGEKLLTATECLAYIKAAFPNTKIDVFTFVPMKMHGCYNHPNIRDSKIMAKQFVEFIRSLN